MSGSKREKWKVNISFRELNTEYRDVPPWRSYELNTYGNTQAQLEQEASISEIDQDGGEIRTYGLAEAPAAVAKEVRDIIREELCKVGITPESELPLKPHSSY